MRCPHCGSALYRDEDGLACLCGYRKYDLPTSTPVSTKQTKPQAKADDGVGWWVALNTTPDAVKQAAADIGDVVMKQSQYAGVQLYLALRVVLVRLENGYEVKLSREQERNLKGFIHHLAA